MRRNRLPLILILGLLLGAVTPFRISYAASAAWDSNFATPTTVATFGTTDRPWGIAAGDFDGDGHVDLVIGRTTGHIFFARGNGDGTFALRPSMRGSKPPSMPGPSRPATSTATANWT